LLNMFSISDTWEARMELRHLLTFQTIIKAGSFLQAAEELQYAQSTITLHIQQLEAELGVRLFARQGKRVQLTETGERLQEYASHLLHTASLLQQEMGDLARGESGRVRIGAIEPTASARLPSLLLRFCNERPRVRLLLEVGGTRTISNRVLAGDLDLGICSPPEPNLGLRFEPLFVEALALLVPERHPLARADTIYPAMLTGQRLLLSEPGCAYRRVIEQALLRQGTDLHAWIEIGSMEVIKRAVQQGLGVAIIPAVAAAPPLPGVLLREIEQVKLGLPVGLVHHPARGVPGKALYDFEVALRNHLQAGAQVGFTQATYLTQSV
jgi:LysR family transcriptional regulator, regulator of the ytmI operon